MGKARKDPDTEQTGDPLNPFKDLPAPEEGSFPDYYGAFSVNIYPELPTLQYSHADAGGWINFLSQFAIPNFWFQDQLVTAKWYYEPTDHYLDTYGIDSVIAAYHSGHGSTVDDVYTAYMGAAEDGEPPEAHSNQMVLGNQRVNYIFWSTCVSLVTRETHNPLTIWDLPDRGFRMLFGFNSSSVDDPHYGQYFWEEWRKGKSFSRAWLDAAWRISISMSPSAAAVGGTEDEARERFVNERYFQAEHVAKNNWVWGWYQSDVAAPPCLRCPGKIIELEPRSSTLKESHRLAAQFQMNPEHPTRTPGEGLRIMKDGPSRLVHEPGGAYEYFLPANAPTIPTPEVTIKQVRNIALNYIHTRGLDGDLTPLCYRRLNIVSAAGPDKNQTGLLGEQAVVFAQTIDGIPVISADAGQLTVAVDGTGRVVQVRDTRRQIKAVRDVESESVSGKELDRTEIDRQLATAAKMEADRRWGGSDRELPELNLVPESILSGYIFEGDQGYFGATAEVEAVFPKNIKKRFKVMIPLCK